MSGFGRKGIVGGGQAEIGIDALRNGVSRPAARAAPQRSTPQDSELARKREAFIAGERSRTGSQGDGGGLSDHSSSYRPAPRTVGERSVALAYILWFILGQFSAHRFYLGANRSAVIQMTMTLGSVVLFLIGPTIGAEWLVLVGLVTMVGGALWLLADIFLIPGLHRRRQQVDNFGATFA